jgi:hypothetical protein
MANSSALDGLAGEPVTLELAADGPWLPALRSPFASNSPAVDQAAAGNTATGTIPSQLAPQAAPAASADTFTGTVTLHNVNWKADYLANHVEIVQAVMHLGDGEQHWDPVVFSYGPVKGTASLDVPLHCEKTKGCAPKFHLQFDELDAGSLQAALLGAHEPGTLLSTLLGRLRPSGSSDTPSWPLIEGTVDAVSLILGPVTLTDARASLHIVDGGAEITDLDADLLGGHVSGGGTLRAAETAEAKPAYSLDCHFDKLSPAEVGKLLGQNWSGRSIEADGKFDLAGFSDTDLAATATGKLHFEWRHGSVTPPQDTPDAPDTIPAALAHFDNWTADAEFANGKADLKDSEVQQGSRKRVVEGALTLGDPPRLIFGASKEILGREMQAKR